MVKIITVAALFGLSSFVSSTTVGCVRDGTENQVAPGIQSNCDPNRGLEKKLCNVFGRNCDICQTRNPNEDIGKDHEKFDGARKWCRDQAFYSESTDKTYSYSLKGFGRV